MRRISVMTVQQLVVAILPWFDAQEPRRVVRVLGTGHEVIVVLQAVKVARLVLGDDELRQGQAGDRELGGRGDHTPSLARVSGDSLSRSADGISMEALAR